jgi:hypothetical protein
MIQSRDQLENAGGNIVGIVYNNFDPGQSTAYPYYSSYYYQYYGTEEGPDGRSKRRRRRNRTGITPTAASSSSPLRPAETPVPR